MLQETIPDWHRRTQTAFHAAEAPQEQTPYCLSSQSLPETSLQAIAGTAAPHISLWSGHSTRPKPSLQAPHHNHPCRQHPGRNHIMAWTAHPLDFLLRQCFRVAESCFVSFFVIINHIFSGESSACMALLGPLPTMGRGGRMHFHNRGHPLCSHCP